MSQLMTEEETAEILHMNGYSMRTKRQVGGLRQHVKSITNRNQTKAVNFPRSPEIKRIIKAANDAGVQIGSVDIRPDGITINQPTEAASASDYDIWTSQNQG
jgi:hypothetical protein